MSYKAVWKSKSEGEYIFEVEGKKLAFMDLLITDTGKVVIKHTEVDATLEGQGIGKGLMQEVAAFAREKNFKILPICPFAKNVMYKYPEEYQGLL